MRPAFEQQRIALGKERGLVDAWKHWIKAKCSRCEGSADTGYKRSLVYRILHLYMESDINSRMQLYCDLVTSLISFQCWQRNWKRAISVYHVGYESEEKKAATSKHCNSGVDGILK